jgi:hypothetical protein
MKHIYLSVATALLMALQANAQMTVEVTTTDATCFGVCDGTAQTVITGGTGPYTYSWATPIGETTPDITGVCGGTYAFLVRDFLGEEITVPFTIGLTDTLQVTGQVTPTSCLPGGDGNIVTFANGGTPPYSYGWNNGMINPDPTGLWAGMYVVWVADANGCAVEQSFLITEGYLEITVETDGTDPCTGPLGLTAVATGTSGNYTYEWSTQETTQSISVWDVPVVHVAVADDASCAASSFLYIPTISGELDYFASGWLNRGFCRTLYALVANNSCVDYTGPVSIELGANVNLSSALPTPNDIMGHVATWNNVTILAGEQMTFEVIACVPLTTECSDWVDVTITTNVSSEVIPRRVFCSYDPNDKQVLPQGVGAEGYIENTERLQYMVRFQNTGEVAATFIHVLDVLDADLDIFSLNVVATSHAMELSIAEDRTLDFFFDNINLPDSTSDLAGSQGFIIYEIDMLPNLSPGTEIENTASIYFDFNPPVITNTTLNTIAFPVGIQDVAAANEAFSVYPNPTTGNVTVVRNGTAVYGLQVYDALGQLLHSVQGNKGTSVVDVAHLPAGMYLLTLEDATGRYQSRLVKN